MYDWANSAFATTILAAVLPIYFSQVAGSTLPSAATATAFIIGGYLLTRVNVEEGRRLARQEDAAFPEQA
jgi:MFS-type transporter involved in bile tolerance (Atg22 family)